MEYKARNEMDPRFQWDMSHIYADKDAWEEAYAKAQALVAELPALEGTLGASVNSLKNGLDKLYEAAEAVELVYLYAMLSKSGDNGDPENQNMDGRAMNLYVAFSTAVSFFDPEVLSIDEATLNGYMNDPALAGYRHILEDTARGRAHTLDAKGERMLALLGDAAQASSNTFDMFESVDMTFPKIKDENGEEVQLTATLRFSANPKMHVYAVNPLKHISESSRSISIRSRQCTQVRSRWIPTIPMSAVTKVLVRAHCSRAMFPSLFMIL